MSQLTDSDNDAGPAGQRTTDLDELLLAAEEAEADAAAAEALAAAARARARAVRLRRSAATARSATPTTGSDATTRLEPRGTASCHGMSATELDATPTQPDAATDSGVATTSEPGAPPAQEPEATTAAARGATAAAQYDAAASAPDAPPATEPDAKPAAEPETTATAGDSAPAPESRRVRRLPGVRTLVGALAVAVIAVCLTVSGMLVHHHREVAQADQRKAEFVEAARQGVVALTSLDFSRAEQDVQRVLEHSTGAFHDDFAGRAADFTSVIEQSQVATAGTVNAAAVESMTEDSAVVLVAATSQVTNSAGAQQEPRAWRLSVTVTREGDTIKMSKVEFVP